MAYFRFFKRINESYMVLVYILFVGVFISENKFRAGIMTREDDVVCRSQLSNAIQNNQHFARRHRFLDLMIPTLVSPSFMALNKRNEEIGGPFGMKAFVSSKKFQLMNVGCALDEGLASTSDVYILYYGERSMWNVEFKISGTAGHGSLLHKNTVGEKFRYILDRLMDYRSNEVIKLESSTNLGPGDVTSINLTKIHCGVQSNVVPSILCATFDIRLSVDVDHDNFEAQVRSWCYDAGGGVELEFELKEPFVEPSKIDDSNIFWLGFKNAVNEMGIKMKTEIFPAGTDSQYIRMINIPAIGFSPMNNTPILAHENDEFIRAETYLKGIEFYEKIISNLGNV